MLQGKENELIVMMYDLDLGDALIASFDDEEGDDKDLPELIDA